ncbi:MAG: transcriptional repressor [Mollicutes bacterium]|nr:transcriptional repressor [Mollicutes bacterium]MDD7264053.1 transcriptional repressor [bacterium]MDY4979151.1 transcriptional repressor [Candidatus Onthovivens sp.]
MERFTIQRKLIFDATKALGHARVKDIADYLNRNSYSISLATIYRNVDSLVLDNLLKRVTLNLKDDYYEISAQPNHDHFICKKCGKIIDVEPTNLNFAPFTDKFGNEVEQITTTYYGTCSDCLKNK